jgi:hypothetical protein
MDHARKEWTMLEKEENAVNGRKIHIVMRCHIMMRFSSDGDEVPMATSTLKAPGLEFAAL